MSTVYRLKASEIDHHFLQEIQAKFGYKKIEIVVSSNSETDYILKS